MLEFMIVMTDTDYVCWKCGAELGDTPLPLAREAKCKSCQAHLHCCRMCIFFDRTVSNQCREPIAETVKDKTRSNFCGYLQINNRAYQVNDDTASKQTKSELEALFNLESSEQKDSAGNDNLDKLNDLFKPGDE